MPAREKSPTSQEVRKAGRAAVAALIQNNIRSCLFGSAACQIYGMKNRLPKDVDIVLLTNDGRDIEYIKQLIVDTNDKFYLVPSKNPKATYEKLYFILPGKRRSCKVDIVLPGNATDLNIPVIPSTELCYISPYNDIPVMPVVTLLLMKLQGWIHHQASPESHKRAKVPEDVKDILELLKLAVEEYDAHMDEEPWMPTRFVNVATARVKQFVKIYPKSKASWRKVGFQI
ncbi:hypothetical protein E1B28_005250 [Marasmius oreades]|uniref:Uncharacterized protein n=1 Tax=Marasmius oreades TaxID=181124 RepID=A0A9P7V0C0_9AGAR|nr:uncharacterized protein E1B28_005250 [Marasmius oreades]KAG7097939.1 hypothetical protein E1B28_005250 [Marasmius oreades]